MVQKAQSARGFTSAPKRLIGRAFPRLARRAAAIDEHASSPAPKRISREEIQSLFSEELSVEASDDAPSNVVWLSARRAAMEAKANRRTPEVDTPA